MTNLTQNKCFEDWISKSKDIPPMTNTQHQFAKLLFENDELLSKWGNLDIIYNSIRKYFKP